MCNLKSSLIPTVGSLKGGCVYTNRQPWLQLNCYVVCTTVYSVHTHTHEMFHIYVHNIHAHMDYILYENTAPGS